MKSSYLYLVLALTLTTFAGCASKSDQKLNEKVTGESGVKTSEDLQKAGNEAIEKTPGLTEEQRTKLLAIRDEVRAKRTELHEESLKLRSVLIKDIVSKGDTETEMNLIKGRLRKIEDERLTFLFGAIDRANAVLGNTAYLHQKELEETLREDHGGRSE